MTINGVSSSLLTISIMFLSLSLLTWMVSSALSPADHPFEIHLTKWKRLSTCQRVSYPEKMHQSRIRENWKRIRTEATLQQWREEFNNMASSRGRRLIATNTTPTASEVKTLLAFKSSIETDPSGALANWTMENNSTCCSTWKGVTCNKIGQVTRIDLGNIELNGTITPMICDLVHLTFLNLSGSRIWEPWKPSEFGVDYSGPIPSGLGTLWGPIPSNLRRCTNLTILDLSFNSLDGESLPELFTLPKLEYLRLSFNKFPRLVTLPEIEENGCQSLKSLRIAFTNISGVIPSSLSRCRNLAHLLLNNNQLNGSIPTSLAELHQLQEIWLENNTLTGQIPSQFGSLKNLNFLSLYENNLDGEIPQSLGMLSQLQYLLLQNNKLTGSIPPSLGNCSSLIGLDLGYQKAMTGAIPPSLGMLRQLQLLHLRNNKLSGSIPPSLGMLSQLQFLHLDNNKLSGSIPPSLGNCSSLVELWLGSSNTGYNDFIGTIPEEFGNLASLELLFLEYNQNLTGPVPGFLSKCSKLQHLFLGGCGFTSIAPEIWNMKSLKQIILYQNSLSGTLPLEVGNCTLLISLDLTSNRLTGSIPPTLGMLKNLTTLSLQANMFTGRIPLLTKCPNLETLRLGQNKFNGSLQLDLTKWSALKCFSISHNNLTGGIPPSFASINSSLVLVDFSHNKFIGGFPNQVDSTHLSNLRVLLFSHNQLEGRIPSWFGNLKSLQVLDLSYNKLTGSIPQNFGNLNGYKVHGDGNASSPGAAFVLKQNINLAMKGQNIRVEYSYILVTTTYMDLSSNALHGEIPQGIANLVALKYLILFNNRLEGVIWSAFQNLKDLETLDLSENNLNGPIPSLLPSSLSTFNVSFNNLSGAIPIGGQFDTFNISSYLPGNPGLCGTIIHLPCVGAAVDPSKDFLGSKFEILDYMSIIGFEIGIASGFFIVVVILFVWVRARVFVFGAQKKQELAHMVQFGRYSLFTYPT